ncbi:MAG: glycoside hydrolase family 3 C-terminal domain-containing protein, partial [Lachnospiraceae bacterium]|nr:glycoside hydrolase family 3 C-terminal domain-containing protein [Lachnospiraceae bacterium]
MKNWTVNEELYAQVARKAQAEGIVMLENRDGALPLRPGSRVALFGRTQFHYYKSGTGSGGLVNTKYVTGIRDAILQRNVYALAQSVERAYAEWLPAHPVLRGNGFTEPWFQEEMEITGELAARAAQEAEAAVVIIGRTAG